NRTEYVIWFLIFVEAILLDNFGHQSGTSFAPYQFIWLLRLTNVPCVGHRFTTDGSFNDPTGRDLLTGNNLAGEDIVFRKIKRLEANNIRIRPPPTALKQ